MIAAFSRTWRRLWPDRSGLALIEFAYSLPVLVLVAMGGTEVANLALTVLRINQMAMLAADNAARVRNSIDETDVNEVMIGMRFDGSGVAFGQNGRVIISSLGPNGQTGSNQGYKINWQRCFGAKNVASSYGVEGAGATDATLSAGMGPVGHKIKPVDNNSLIFAEVRYTYHPLVAPAFMGTKELRSIQAFTVRDRASETLTNTKSLPDSQKRLCDAAHLSAS